MQVKIFRAYSHKGLEKYINIFLEENKERIHVMEIKFSSVFEYVAMIVFEEKISEE